MSGAKLTLRLKSASLRENDRLWFGRWVGAYRKSCGVGPHDMIPVERDSVIGFLQQQKTKGRKAWQRLQILRAIVYYRDNILETAEPDLSDVRLALTKAAEVGRTSDAPSRSDIDVIGNIDPNEPEPIQNLRRKLRMLHRSPKTEKAYVLRVRQFLRRFNIANLKELDAVGEAEITQFLTEMAVDRHVAASTF